MDTNGTNINDLIEKNKLSNEESSIVDSIVDELNTRGNPQSSQEKLPQISEEEKEMLIRQRNQQEQQKRQYQYIMILTFVNPPRSLPTHGQFSSDL